MSEADRPPPRSPVEPLASCLARSAARAALFGATLGALEALHWLVLDPPRTASRAVNLAWVAVVGDALLGALLGLGCGLAAWLLWRPAEHRAAPPSACAGLGSALGLAAWLDPFGEGALPLVAAALGGTLVCLALRELLAWWSLPWSVRPWVAALGLAVLALTLRVALLSGPEPSGALPDRAPNVLLVSIDTLRADHLGCYGADDARTPTIDGLAAQGVLFEDATAQANTTGPSHTTMLTGLYPAGHGALSNGVPIAASVPTLADVLRERGWRTGAFVSGFTMVDDASGLAGRFQTYDDDLTLWTWISPGCERLRLVDALIRRAALRGRIVLRGDRPADETVDGALAWLANGAERSFFLLVHLYDPHAPYEPPREAAEQHGVGDVDLRDFDWYRLDTEERRALVDDSVARERMAALYRAEITFADAQLGRLLAALERRGALDDTLVVLTSDHGESLGPHGTWFDHGTFLYDEELHVPLVVRLPGGAHAGTRVAGQVRLLDLAPTILGLVGQAGALDGSGEDLGPLLDGAAPAPGHPSFAIADVSGELAGFARDGRRLSLRRDGRKLIWTSEHWLDTQRVAPRLEAYDLRADPGELSDLVAAPGSSPPAGFEPLVGELEAFRDASERQGAGAAPDAAVLERLRAIGY